MRRGRDPCRTPSRPRRPVWDNPRGQIPGTGIRSDAENLYSGNLRGGSAQGVSGNSSGSLPVTGESSSGGRSLPVNVLGKVLEEPLLVGRQVPVLVKKDLACFQIQETVFQFSILLRRLWRHLVQQRGVNLSAWELMSF